MNYEEAKQKVLNSIWKIDVCHVGEECWCRSIRPAEDIKYTRKSNGELDNVEFVIHEASIDEKTAKYIVELHNNFIEKKPSISFENFKKINHAHNNYDEAQQYSLNILWKLEFCNVGEKCWCRIILPTQKIEYVHKYSSGNETVCELDCIVPDGAIDKDIAEYIVDLHNKRLNKLCTCPVLDDHKVTGSSCKIHGLPFCE